MGPFPGAERTQRTHESCFFCSPALKSDHIHPNVEPHGCDPSDTHILKYTFYACVHFYLQDSPVGFVFLYGSTSFLAGTVLASGQACRVGLPSGGDGPPVTTRCSCARRRQQGRRLPQPTSRTRRRPPQGTHPREGGKAQRAGPLPERAHEVFARPNGRF